MVNPMIQNRNRERKRRLDDRFLMQRHPFDRPILLLTTTGAKSGQRRTTPMMCIPDGDRLLVIASNAGAPRHPDWYRNLVAHPDVAVELGKETFDATAVVVIY